MSTEYELAISKLHKKRPSDRNYFCPCHDDKVASLSIKEGKEGKALLYCHAGCSFENIIKALDIHPDKANGNPIITATYDYTDAEGKLLYQVVRYYPKNFKQRRPDGQGGWVWDLKGIQPSLYNLPALILACSESQPIYIVEGEKDVETLKKHKITATTISGGASTKWHPSLIPLFENAQVVIIPDNDVSGKKYAQYVASILHGWASSLKLVELPLGKDTADYLETQSIDNLLNLVYNTGEFIPQGAVTREEFESFKGVNHYLWHMIKTLKTKVKKYKYN